MSDTRVAVLVFLELGTGGDKAELARPSNRQFIGCEFSSIAEMRVPAFSGANEQHAVSRVFDHVAAIVKMKSKFEARRRTFRKDDVHEVVAASAELLQGHALILKEGQRFTVLTRHSVGGQGARTLKHQEPLVARFGAHLEGPRVAET